MFPDGKRLAVVLLLLIPLPGFGALPHYSLDAITPDGADITVVLPAGMAVKDEQCIFAFSTLPGRSFSAVAETDDGRTVSCLPLGSGWAGENYLQWCGFSSKQVSRTETAITVKIRIRFQEREYANVDRSRSTFTQGILRVPLPRPPAKTAAALPLPPYRIGLRMEVSRDGIYQVSGRMLRDCNVPVDRIATRTFRLFERDREIPLFIPNAHHATLTNDDVVLFYGKRLRSASGRLDNFSETNSYWLTWGGAAGIRVAVVSGARRVDPTVYTVNRSVRAREYIDTLHLEVDSTILWLGNIADQPAEELTDIPGVTADFDNWYWGTIGVTELTSFSLTIPAPAARGYARLRCGLMGLSGIDSIAPDHAVEIFINDQPAGKRNGATWDGQRFFEFESDTFANDLLVDGDNKLTFHTTSPFADRSALNWVDIEYLRGYASKDDRVEFKSDARSSGSTMEYSLTGFSNNRIEVWDITRSRTFTGMITERGSGTDRNKYTLVFQDSIGSVVNYFAQSTDLRNAPLKMKLDTIADFSDLPGDIDYLAISVDSFRTELEPLLEAHRKTGLKAAFVAVDDIYNRFCYGVHNPEGIRRFLEYLLTRFGGRLPRYLLFGGDTTHDLDKKNNSRNLVPTHLSRIPGWGPGADDGYFATVAGDDLFPDMAVGRLPAQNRAEMRTLVEKTIRYITTPDLSYWNDQLLMLGGGEPVFTQFNDESSREIVGDRMQVFRMDADPNSVFYKDEFVAPRLIADYCNSGVYIVNFNGHGGGNIWSDNSFFGYNDLSKLHNGRWNGSGRLPVVFSFTCLTGFFESAEYRSLGEEFVRSGSDGAIAFYGASAYTSRNGNLIMNRLMLDLALGGQWETIGELIDCCEMNMLVRYGTQYIHLVRQYNLLGDPALPWRTIPDTLPIVQTVTDSGTRLSVTGTAAPVGKGEVKVTLNALNQTWNQAIVPVDKGVFSCTFPLKDGMRSSLVSVRAYAWNDSTAVRGWEPFIKDTLRVTDVQTRPRLLLFDDSAAVSCMLPYRTADESLQVYCLYALAEKNDSRLSFSGVAMKAETGGRWVTSTKVPLPFTGTVSKRLQVCFRVFTGTTTLQSGVFSFGINGRPDLTVAGGGTRIVWHEDSLRIPFEILNAGNSPAPSFTVACCWNRRNQPPDTFALVSTPDSLPPGGYRSFSVALADTQGVLDFSLNVNPLRDFPEITFANNRSSGVTRVFFGNIREPSDTLSVDSGRIRISPVRKLDQPHRLFFFEDTIGAAQPLVSPSVWVARRESLNVRWHTAGRPAMASGDSLLWIWNRSRLAGLLPSDTVQKKVCFMLFDTLIGRWRYYDGVRYTAPGRGVAVTMKAASGASFTVAALSDDKSPDLMASVYGKALTRPDYTAKDHPFTVLLSDQSELLPQSVVFYLNGKRLPETSRSEVPSAGDLRSISVTAYPPVERRVDSLRVECADLAGNPAKRTFAYLPGSDLTIKSFSCHPNPFTARRRPDGTIQKIRFAFLLTDMATNVTLSIYTVSGKKIITWNRNELIGYQQIEWDGRDRDGYRLANGTYYAKLIVKNDRKKAKKILRIAKLEGF